MLACDPSTFTLTDLRVAEAKDAAQAHQIAAEAVPNITDYTRDVVSFLPSAAGTARRPSRRLVVAEMPHLGD